LERWCSDVIPENEPWLVVNSEAAKYFWRHSAEYRTLTALNKKKTAQGQSLRRIELVPEGTLFLSFVSWLDNKPLTVDLDGIQVGAWESLGLGFSKISAIENSSTAANIKQLTSIELAPNDSLPEYKVMIDCHERISDLSNKNDKEICTKIRSIISNFGSRAQIEGLETALGFEFAKAKIATKPSKDKKDTIAHRLFLCCLLSNHEKVDDDSLFNCWQKWFCSPISPKIREELLLRWRWLKRYGEIILKRKEQS